MRAVVASLRGFSADIAVRRGRGTDSVAVLDRVDLTVRAGCVTALIGESGCGKSMVAAALAGLMPPGSRVRGTVRVGETDMDARDEKSWRALRGHRIGLVPQSAATSFTPVRTVGSQLAEICARLGADRNPEQLCAAVALPADVVDRYPGELSGGMAQRVAIAAALAGRPALLLADEPTSALDPGNAELVWHLLGQACADGAGVLVITHDMPSLLRAQKCDDVAVMARGRVLDQLPLDAALASTDPYLRALLNAVPA